MWAAWGDRQSGSFSYCVHNIKGVYSNVNFRLEIVFTGKSVGIMAKSSKTLQDALSAVLQKHHLKLQDVQLTMVRTGV